MVGQSTGPVAASPERHAAPRRDFLPKLKLAKVRFREPANAGKRWARFPFRQIDNIDVLVSGRDVRELDAEGTTELPGLTGNVNVDTGRTNQPDGDACLLLHLAHRSVVRHLVRLNMPARRQPPAQARMPSQQHTPTMHDEDGNREVAR
jgi:hypothetical protein